MKPLNKIIWEILTSWGKNRIQVRHFLAIFPCIFAFFLLISASAQTIYIGNSLSVPGGGPDGGFPLVILGEYSPPGPLATASPTTTLPSGTVQDVQFYGQNYNFTLYALSYVTNNPYANEQIFQVVASETFSNNAVATPGTNLLMVTNFVVTAGDLLAFCGQGPYYPQFVTNDTFNSDATYQNPFASSQATPPILGQVFSVGTDADTNATYGYITDAFGDQGRTYGIGVDIMPASGGYAFGVIAGSSTNGDKNGFGTSASFNNAAGITVDTNFNLFVSDTGNDEIREVVWSTTNWLVTGVAGTNHPGSVDGQYPLFNGPQGITIDSADNLYVADTLNNTIRKVSYTGSYWNVTTIAGSTTNTAGSANGTNRVAEFNNPQGITVDSSGNLYVADTANDTIRKMAPSGTNWIVTTIAGLAQRPGAFDGTNSNARFDGPEGIATDKAGNLYVADTTNDIIRKLTLAGTNWVVSTIGGQGTNAGCADGINGHSRFYLPGGITADNDGNLYVADTGNDTVREISQSGGNWTVKTVIGLAGNSGDVNGSGPFARLMNPKSVTVDQLGTIYNDSDIGQGFFCSGGVDVTGDGFNAGDVYYITVDLGPSVVTPVAAWTITNTAIVYPARPSGATLAFVTNNATLTFKFLNGWIAPVNQPIGVPLGTGLGTADQTNLYYTLVPPLMSISLTNGVAMFGTTNLTYTVESSSSVLGPWNPVPTFNNFALLFSPTQIVYKPWVNGASPTFYRAKWSGN